MIIVKETFTNDTPTVALFNIKIKAYCVCVIVMIEIKETIMSQNSHRILHVRTAVLCSHVSCHRWMTLQVDDTTGG